MNHSFKACDWLLITDVRHSCARAPLTQDQAWVDRDSWWSASWYQQSQIGLVWFCQLKTNPVTLSLFSHHHGTGPRFTGLPKFDINILCQLRVPESVTRAANSQSHGTWRASAKRLLVSLLSRVSNSLFCWRLKVRSRHIVITLITRYQLVKSVHVLVELVITTCDLGVFWKLRLVPCDRCTSHGTSEKWRRFQRKLLLL